MDNEEYRITPKGIFFASLLKTNLIDSLHDKNAEETWSIFESLMEKHGYTKTESTKDLERKLP